MMLYIVDSNVIYNSTMLIIGISALFSIIAIFKLIKSIKKINNYLNKK